MTSPIETNNVVERLAEREMRELHRRLGGSSDTFAAIMAVELARTKNTPDSEKDGA